ncbi:MAG: S-layer homology domain-containing protein [Slackia sp.]|nr:S-layer homology domain-containing protein [Slackia sp.]
MEMQSKRNKALSVVTAATLAASLGVPAVAVADEVDQAVVVQESGGARSEEAADAGVVAAPETNVAQVGDKQYETLSQAIAEAPSGSVITMIADATISDDAEEVCGKALTLDLNGNRIDAIGSAFAIYDGGALTLRDSSKGQSGVVSADARGTSAITVGNGSFVMEGGTIESGVCLRVGVIHNGAAEEEFQVGRSVVDIKGGVIDAEYTAISVDGFKERSGVSVSLSGGLVSGGGHGIWTSAASYPNQNQNGVARPHGGVKVSISGGTLRAGAGDNTHGVALCLDGVNDVAEVTGGTIEGDTGIEVAAGELLVSGDAAITGTGRFLESSHTDHGDYGPNRISGCGIAVAQEVTKERINVQISGAPSISGVYGLREWNLENNAPEDIAKVTVRIDGGTFMSKGSEYGGAALEIADCKGVVTGGRYNTVPSSDLIAEGRVAMVGEDGMASIVDEADVTYCAQVGGKQYATVSQAIAEAPSGATIGMITNATLPSGGEGLFDKALTLDLNGKRIDASGSAFSIDRNGSMVLDDSSDGQSGVVRVSKGEWGGRETPGIAVAVGTGSFVMKGGTIESADDGLYVGSSVSHDWNMRDGRPFAEVQGGVIKAGRSGIFAQGSKERGFVSVLVSGGVVEGAVAGVEKNRMPELADSDCGAIDSGVKLTISGGTVKATGDRGIGVCTSGINGSTEITGGIVEGKTGVEVGAGKLSVSGDAVIKGTGPFSEEPRTSINNDGRNRITGCGIAVAQEMTKAPVSVVVSGSPAISGVYGLRESNLQQNAPEDIAKVAVRIDGGTFMSTDSASGAALESTDCKGIAWGGRYNTEPSADLIAEGYVVQAAEDGMVEVVSASPAPGPGPAPEPAPDPEPEVDVDVEQRPDGSTVTTETAPDGSQTVTTESADGTASVVSKDADGNITSAEVAVSDEAVEAGRVVLPLESAKPAVDADKAPAVEVKMPTAAAGAAPVKVAVPVAASEDGAPNHGVVVYAVDADGNGVLLPKCGVDAEGNAVFEAEGDVTIKVVDASPSFPDVEGAWYGSDGTADFVGARGILTGVPQGDGTLLFDGGAPTTRAMFVTMLHRAESKPLAPEAGFEDVDGEWFAAAAAWGEATGVVNGYGDGSVFGGNDPVTREQMAVFAMRYAQHLGLDTSARADLSGFADGAQASDYAAEALSWAVAEGVINGHADGSGRLDPRGGATRAETAAVVMRFINGMYE